MAQTKEELQQMHTQLHKSLDSLVACYIGSTKRNLTNTSVMELIEWSFKQTSKPSCFKEELSR